jgi:hypothetical protein
MKEIILTNVLPALKRSIPVVATPYGPMPYYVLIEDKPYELTGNDWDGPRGAKWSGNLANYLIEDLRYASPYSPNVGVFIEQRNGRWCIITDRAYPPYKEIIVEPLTTRKWNRLTKLKPPPTI